MAKVFPIRLDEQTFAEMEKLRKRLSLPRNTYIRKAIIHYNALHTRQWLEREYRNASRRLGAAHLEYLRETELLEDL